MIQKLTHNYLIALAILILLAVFFQFSSPNISDPDSFYHIRHAYIYRTQGLTQTDFPWTQYSVINQLKSDIWYGFHILLTPFTYFSDPAFGIKIAGVFLTALVLILFFGIIKKIGVTHPLFWAIILFFLIPDLHWRLLMVRPHILTFILSFSLLYFLTKNNRWGVFLAAFLIAFFHLSLSWIAVLILGAVLLSKALAKIKISPIPAIYIIAGIVMGWLSRPNPIAGIQLAYIQVVQLMIEKLANIPIRFGTELRPGSSWTVLADEIAPILIIILFGILFWRLSIKRNDRHLIIATNENFTILSSSLILAAIFGFMTIFIARRSIDLFAGFGLLFSALSYSLFGPKTKQFKIIGGIFFIILMVNTLYFANIYKNQAPEPDTFKASSQWLKENTAFGTIVFNIHWDNFPMLFFWNRQNYYINGMDPIFEYAYSPALYWQNYYVDIDQPAIKNNIAYTCALERNKCDDTNLIEVYHALKDNFKAGYIFVEPQRNPLMYKYLISDTRFQKVFDAQNKKESIFKIL